MSVLHLKQNVVVKVVVTEKFKEDFKKDLQRQLENAESKARDLKSSMARVVIESAGIQNASYVETLKARIEEERMLQEALASQLRDKLREIDELPVGSVYPYVVLEGFVDVQVGDDLFKKISSQEIILKDGIVTEIKEGT
ncbi:MAG: YlqD family protein [Caldisericaceae bacterium]